MSILLVFWVTISGLISLTTHMLKDQEGIASCGDVQLSIYSQLYLYYTNDGLTEETLQKAENVLWKFFL